MQQILDFYKTTAPVFALHVDEDGMLYTVSPTGSKKPLMIEEGHCALPTEARLRKGFPEDIFPFHPLCESMTRQGTSPVIKMLQRAAKVQLSYHLVATAHALMEVAVNVDMHKDIPPDSADFLVRLADVDKEKKMLEVLDRVVGAAAKKNRLVSVYLKNGGTFEGEKMNRMAIIRFPILEDLQVGEKDVLGVAVTKRQRKLLIALFKMIVPFGDNPEEYAYGTISHHAPYLTCLLHAFHKTLTVMNRCINSYCVPLQLAVKPIPTFDIDEVANFKEWRAKTTIPALRGNEGATNEATDPSGEDASAKAKAEAVKPSNPIEQPKQNGFSEVQRPPVPVATEKSTRGASISDLRAAMNPHGTNTGFGHTQQNGFGQQPSGFGQPGPSNNPWGASQQQGFGSQQRTQPNNGFGMMSQPNSLFGGSFNNQQQPQGGSLFGTRPQGSGLL